MVDQAKVVIKAGNGGDGVVHFHRARFIPKGGPDGGDGGRGGSVFVVTDPNLATLDHFAYKQRFGGESGRPGGGSRSSGAAGEDLYLRVPVGTVVEMKRSDLSTSVKMAKSSELAETKTIDFDKEGMEVLVAKGGKGGKGNWHFRSSTNTTPREATPGVPGEEWQVEMNLKLLADVGLIGLPNVGKSTLLSILSRAKPKIADYPFTTLEPNLGVAELSSGKRRKSVVIADIPGLIEGASAGKGLGTQFLRHIERTKLLVHILALMGADADLSTVEVVSRLAGDYKTIRDELTSYGAGLENKSEIVVVNKVDLLPEERVAEVIAVLAKKRLRVTAVSAGTLSGVEGLKKELGKLV